MTVKVTSFKWLLPLVTPIIFTVLIAVPTPCCAVTVNCSKPNQLALLEALTPIFDLSAIRPVKDMGTKTNITTNIVIYAILGVDEKAQILMTYIWLNFWWQNEFVSWDPDQCGTDRISLPKDKFWVPDIVISEFMDENKAPSVPYLFLHSNGTVYDGKPAKVVSSCNLNIYTFPFDIQNCTLTFNSYIHQDMDIMIWLKGTASDITERSKMVMSTMGEWELLDITAHKPPETKYNIDELVFHVRLRRRSATYVVNLLIPSCFLITVDLCSFLLPPQSTDRSSFKMTLILGYTVFLLIMNDLLPATGNTMPLINVIFSMCLALMVSSLLETILITNMMHSPATSSAVPRWIRVPVLQILGRLLFLPSKTKTQGHSDIPIDTSTVTVQHGTAEWKGSAAEVRALEELKSLSRDVQIIRFQVEQKLSATQRSEEWLQVGVILDRLLFGLYILFISVSFITIITIWFNSH